MTTLMELAVKLVGDITGYKRSMDEAQATAQKTSVSIGKSLEQVGAKLTGIGKGMTAAVTLPIVAAGVAALNSASDLEETRNRVQTVFGDMSDSVLSWSENSAVAFGMSKTQALAATAVFGTMFTGMRISRAQAEEMSTSLVQLAADLAEFNGEDPSTMLDQLQSGLIGRGMELRKLGIDLSDVTVKAKALAMGLANSRGELSDAALVAARYALIMEQTKIVQGNFANSSGELGHDLVVVKAQLANAAANLGTLLLPYAIKAVEWIGGLIAKIEALSPSMKKWVVIIAAVAAAMGPVLIVIGSLISALGVIIPIITALGAEVILPVIAIIAAVVAVIALLVIAWKNNWLGIRDFAAATMEYIREKIYIGLKILQMLWVTYGQDLWNRVKEIWNGVVDAFKKALAWVMGIVQDAHHYMDNWWKQHGRGVQATVLGFWKLIQDAFNIAVAVIKAVVGVALDFIKAFWDQHGAAIMKIVNNMWQGIKNIFKGVMDAIGFIFDAFGAAFRGDWKTFGEDLRKVWDALWGIVVKNVKLAWENIKIVFADWWKSIKDYFSKLDMKTIGKALIDGLINGLKNAIPNLVQAISDIGNAFMKAWKGFWGIKSPSIKMRMEARQLGAGTQLGWIDSVQDWISSIPRTMNGLAPAVMAQVPAMSTAVMPAMAAAGSGGGMSVIVPIEIKSLINTADEYTAQNILAPMVIKSIREYLNR